MKNDNNINNFKRNEPKGTKQEKYLKKWKKLLDNDCTMSVLFSGVGGQGIILTTTVLAEAALLDGLDVKVSEVHGMAQRGGSVIGSVRIGRKVYSPIPNDADFIVSLEKLEAVRYIDRLDKEGFIIVNDFEVYPVSMYLNGIEYPENILSILASCTSNYMIVKATEIAKRLGEIRVSNTVLLGSLSNFIPIKTDSWIKSIKDNVPKYAVEINVEAFKEGKKIISQ
jgi:indolepyruvate ferredoxin oxidoreductase beta subunit